MRERLKKFHDYFQASLGRVVDTLERLVAMETPSRDRARIDRFAEHYADLLRPHCSRVSIVAGDLGARVRAECGSGNRTILVLGHIDTVWPAAATADKPRLRRDGDRLYGPGVFDMKAGLCLVLFAFEAMAKLGVEPDRRVLLLCTPDEESGSPSSREAIEREAAEAAAVVVLEPPLDDGSLKMRRKGGGRFRIEVSGREAHAGINPHDGVNALHELALQVARLVDMNDLDKGITVNVCRAAGGSAENVIPGRAWAVVDFRTLTASQAEELAAEIAGLEPILEGAGLEITGGIARRPVEETPESMHLASLAQEIAAELEMPLEVGVSGGGSDGSFTAALGIPTIDGLSLDGAGAHCLGEHVVTSRIPQRGALLAELLLRI